jgi:hypothetical protein
MASPYDTDLQRLVECVGLVAEAMGAGRPNVRSVEAFLKTVLFAPASEGGKDILGCLSDGLITEGEARDLLMANVATWVAHLHGSREPSAKTWTSRELELEFETALLGRPARR